MENQHRKITGYRELNQEEIDLMNGVKSIGVLLGELVHKVQAESSTDIRWAVQAQMTLQTGMMQLTRSIAQPTTF